MGPDRGELSSTALHDDGADQNIRGIWNRFAVFLEVLDADLDRLANVRERFFYRLALRVTSGERRTEYDVATILVRLQQHLEVQGLHPPQCYRGLSIATSTSMLTPA